MKKFILNNIIFLTIIVIVHVSLAFFADKSTDDYYQKFASPKQEALVLGTSRALQGIIPEIVDSVIGIRNNISLFNFAFTINSSPYGEVYFNAVKKKVLEKSCKGYFIVTVDPWSISEKKHQSIEYDTNSVLYNMNNFSSKPNFEYLTKRYPNGWGTIVLKKIELSILKHNNKKLNNSVKGSFSEIDKNGWLNVYTSMDSHFVNIKEIEKFHSYTKSAENNKFSTYS